MEGEGEEGGGGGGGEEEGAGRKVSARTHARVLFGSTRSFSQLQHAQMDLQQPYSEQKTSLICGPILNLVEPCDSF